jgi:hypothetical protein
LSYEICYKNFIGVNLEKEAIHKDIFYNYLFMRKPASMSYLNRKFLACFQIKFEDYQLILRGGVSKTQYIQSYTVGWFSYYEPAIDGYIENKTGFVVSPEFRFPIVKRFQAKVGIEWMIFPAKIPNLFEANVGIIYNMKRIKNRIKN